MRRAKIIKIIIAVIALAAICGIGFYRIQQYPLQQMPTAFAQAQPGIVQTTYADNGKLLLLSDNDENVALWDTATKRQVGKINAVGRLVRANQTGTLVLFCDAKPEKPDQKTPLVSHLTLLRFPANERHSDNRKYDIEKWTTPGTIVDTLPDLSRLLIKNPPNTFALVDIEHQKVLSQRTFNKSEDGIRSATFSRDGKYILSPSLEHHSYVLNTADLSTFRELPSLKQLAFSNDGRYIAGITRESGFQSWNVKTETHIAAKIPYSRCILIFPDDDNHFLIYGFTGAKDHREVISGIFSSGGKYLRDNPKDTYRSEFNGQKWRIVSHGSEIGYSYRLGVSVPYADVINLQSDNIVHRLDVVTDILGNQRAWNGRGSIGNCKYAIAPDGSQAAVVTPGNMIRFYDFHSRNAPHSAPYTSNSNGRSVFQADGIVSDFITLSNGGFAVCSTSDDRNSKSHVDVVNSNGKIQSYEPGRGIGSVSRLSVSPDGKTLAGSTQWGMWLLNVASGTARETPLSVKSDGTQYYSHYPAAKPLWRTLKSASPYEIGQKDVGKNPILRTDWGEDAIGVGSKTILPYRMTRNGYHYWTDSAIPSPSGGKMIVFWVRVNSRNEKIKKIITLYPENFSNGILEIRNSYDGTFRRVIEVPKQIKDTMGLPQVVWSQDGKLLAITDRTGLIYVWDTDTGKQVAFLSDASSQYKPKAIFTQEVPGGTDSMAFSPDNKLMAITRGDGTIYLYSLKTQLPMAQIGKATNRVSSLKFSSDGELIYGVTNHEVRSWKVPTMTP